MLTYMQQMNILHQPHLLRQATVPETGIRWIGFLRFEETVCEWTYASDGGFTLTEGEIQ